MPGSGGCGRVTLKHHKALPSCLSWLSLQHFLGCSKSLTVFLEFWQSWFLKFLLVFSMFLWKNELPFLPFLLMSLLKVCIRILFYSLLLFYPFSKYLLSTYHVLFTLISPGDKIRMETNPLLYWSTYPKVCW